MEKNNAPFKKRLKSISLYIQTHREKTQAMVVGALIILFAAIIVLFGNSLSIRLQANEKDGDGISPNTHFALTYKGKKSMAELREAIVFEPKISFTIQPDGENAYRLKPVNALEAGEALKVSVLGKNFNFKVQPVIQVLSTFPKDESTGIPLNSGIEFDFNTSDITVASMDSSLSIEPYKLGSLAKYGSRYVFKMDEDMIVGTRYVVTLRAGLQDTRGNVLKEDHTFSFFATDEYSGLVGDGQYGNVRDDFQMYGNSISLNALPDEAPVFQAYIGEGMEETLHTKLYAYSGPDAYREAMQNSLYKNVPLESAIDVTGCNLAAEFDIAPQPIDAEAQEGKRWALPFPEAVGEGWYAVEFSIKNLINDTVITRKQFLQVSNVSVFYMFSGENLLAWVNDAATGQPLQGASFAMTDDYKATAVTGADGTAVLENAKFVSDNERSNYNSFIIVKDGERTFVDLYTFYEYSSRYGTEDMLARRYMTTLYTDRPIYMSSDAIHLWGMVRPRDAAATSSPTQVKIQLDN